MAIMLRELANMPESARNRELGALVARARAVPNGQLTKLNAEIHDFEIRYELGSDAMRAAVKAGTLAETAEIAKWLILLRIRERVTAK